MDTLKVVETFATIIGIISQFGYFPQTYKIIKNKSVENVSIFTYSIWMVSVITWFVYGLFINSFAMIASYSFAIIGCLSVIVAYLTYRDKENVCKCQNDL